MISANLSCRLRASTSLAVVLTAIMATPVQAQVSEQTPEQAQALDQTGFEATTEIIVTAQKRTERLIEVPLAVTAVSGSALASQQINDAASLVRAVPSLTFQPGQNPSNSSFRIRGVGSSVFSQGIEPSVAVVVDGVVAARAAVGFSDLADIERVEVLRGPQGTLFGKNATAGVVNVVTARPGRSFGGSLDATVAEQDEYRIKGTVTGPLTDTLRARLTAYYNDIGGFLRNVTTNEDANGQKSWGLRGKLEWDATANLNLLLTAEYREIDANCCSRVPVSIANPALLTLLSPVVPSSTNRQIATDGMDFLHSNATNVTLQADWDLGPATVTSITAYQHYYQDDNYEPDQAPTDPVRIVGPSGYAQWNLNQFQLGWDQYSQEIRLSSNGSQDLTYVVGAYAAALEMDRSAQRRRATCAATSPAGAACPAPIYQSSAFTADFGSRYVAGFGQLDYRVVGGLHLLGGLRVQYERQTASGAAQTPTVTGDTVFPGVVNHSGTAARHDTAVTGKAGVRYEFNRNAQFYASYTRGYKAFALDFDAATRYDLNVGVEPEKVNAYEAGLKWRSSDGKFDISTAVFRSDYRDLQVQVIRTDPDTGVFNTVLTNAGKSRSQGVEIEATMRPSRNLTVGASFTYIDSSVDVDGLPCALQLQAAAANVIYTADQSAPKNTCYRRRTTVNGVTSTSTPIVDVAGGELPVSPKYRFSISPRYESEIGGTDLSAFIQFNLNYQSDVNFALQPDPLLKQDGYALVDASVGLTGPDDKWSVTLFVRNLFDTNYYALLSHSSLGSTATNYPSDLYANLNKDADRFFGASFGYRF